MLNLSVSHRSVVFAIALGFAGACHNDDGAANDGADDDGGSSADDDGTGDGSSGGGSNSSAGSGSGGSGNDGNDDAADASAEGSTDGGSGGDAIYEESFDEADGSPWPAPWQPIGTSVTDVVIDHGRGRFSGASNHTARVALTGFEVVDVDVEVVVEYENWNAQGIGFYARQNGGALQDTDPHGQGYGVYAEGASMRALGLWKEIDGVEMPILEVPDAIVVESGTPYRIRFQCRQSGGTTSLRAKMWKDGDSEPSGWMVEADDATPQLQGTAGSFSADVYNYSGTGHAWLHSVSISEL